MSCQHDQKKQIGYAAASHFFVERECILTAFEKNFLKKFDREKSAGLAFETDAKPFCQERHNVSIDDSHERRIQTFFLFQDQGELGWEERGHESKMPGRFFFGPHSEENGGNL
jgi:hypothetical protein